MYITFLLIKCTVLFNTVSCGQHNNLNTRVFKEMFKFRYCPIRSRIRTKNEVGGSFSESNTLTIHDSINKLVDK